MEYAFMRITWISFPPFYIFRIQLRYPHKMHGPVAIGIADGNLGKYRQAIADFNKVMEFD
jgi:hypothetical protein